jgi:hypothetical protein
MAVDVANGGGSNPWMFNSHGSFRTRRMRQLVPFRVPVAALILAAQQRFLRATRSWVQGACDQRPVPASGNYGHSAILDLDIGAEHGVFMGMTLFSGPRQARGSMVVNRVDATSSSARFIWFTDGPQVGTPVSTAGAV